MTKTVKTILSIASLVTLISTSLISQAQQISPPPNLATLSKNLHGKNIKIIEETPIKGLYMISIENTPFYISQDGRYVFQGSLVDLDTRTDLSENFSKKMRAETIKNLKDEDLIVYPAKDAKHSIYVFTDIDCGYCRKLHENLQSYLDAGITIKYLAFPRSGSNTESAQKAIRVWCSKDRNKALTDAKSGQQDQGEVCETSPVNAQYALGVSMGINGTPAIILDDGSLIPGYVTADKLAELFNTKYASDNLK